MHLSQSKDCWELCGLNMQLMSCRRAPPHLHHLGVAHRGQRGPGPAQRAGAPAAQVPGALFLCWDFGTFSACIDTDKAMSVIICAVAQVDITYHGHDHIYERTCAQLPTLQLDPILQLTYLAQCSLPAAAQVPRLQRHLPGEPGGRLRGRACARGAGQRRLHAQLPAQPLPAALLEGAEKPCQCMRACMLQLWLANLGLQCWVLAERRPGARLPDLQHHCHHLRLPGAHPHSSGCLAHASPCMPCETA
jgi:hypothetical protein